MGMVNIVNIIIPWPRSGREPWHCWKMRMPPPRAATPLAMFKLLNEEIESKQMHKGVMNNS